MEQNYAEEDMFVILSRVSASSVFCQPHAGELPPLPGVFFAPPPLSSFLDPPK